MGKTAQTAPSAGRWSHFWRLLRDLEEAMDTSAVDMLHRRISMLEREVAEIINRESERSRRTATVPARHVSRRRLAELANGFLGRREDRDLCSAMQFRFPQAH